MEIAQVDLSTISDFCILHEITSIRRLFVD